MKKVGLFAVITLAMLTALVVYSLTILGQYDDLEQELSEEYVAGAQQLQATDDQFPNPATGTLDEKRFGPWLEARTSLAELLTVRLQDPKKVSRFQVRKTRNLALAKLAEALDQRSMGISEYCAIAERWRAILARPEFNDLQAKWRSIVRTQSNPEGMALPKPAPDASPAELALIKTHSPQLLATMDADKLSILLDLIAGGEIPMPKPKAE